MTDVRSAQILAFLDQTGWGLARRIPLAGDASDRRYERLIDGPGGKVAILMDAPSQAGDEIRLIGALTRFLLDNGFSAPRIYAMNEDTGLALLEDFGDALFARVLDADPGREASLYAEATNLLVKLHAARPPQLPAYDTSAMIEGVALAFEWYGLGATGHFDREALAGIRDGFAKAFEALPSWQPVTVLRDYHAENLFWLEDRKGFTRVGLIDFQDAVLGHPAYDLVSLARDVRRDVSTSTFDMMLGLYCQASGIDPEGFRQAAAVVSAQRNLRILGIFARLSMHFGKPGYVDLLPRTWTNLMADLSHPALADLADRTASALPAPTSGVLSRLKMQCGKYPDP